jgi:hypothetical protein
MVYKIFELYSSHIFYFLKLFLFILFLIKTLKQFKPQEKQQQHPLMP